jgi:hypothetical protein
MVRLAIVVFLASIMLAHHLAAEQGMVRASDQHVKFSELIRGESGIGSPHFP